MIEDQAASEAGTRPYRISETVWVDLNSIRSIWIVDYNPSEVSRLVGTKSVRPGPMQYIVWVAISVLPGQIEVGRFGDRADAMDAASNIAKLWTGS